MISLERVFRGGFKVYISPYGYLEEFNKKGKTLSYLKNKKYLCKICFDN